MNKLRTVEKSNFAGYLIKNGDRIEDTVINVCDNIRKIVGTNKVFNVDDCKCCKPNCEIFN